MRGASLWGWLLGVIVSGAIAYGIGRHLLGLSDFHARSHNLVYGALSGLFIAAGAGVGAYLAERHQRKSY